MLTPTEKIWHNGRFIRWEDAHDSRPLPCGELWHSVFEGIRCYATSSGPAVFRLHEHVRRMVDSAKIYRMEELGFSREQLAEAMLELVRVNELHSCYIRPIAMRGYGEIGVNPLKNPIDVYIACWEWGKYLGEEALAEGVDVCVSSWNRIAPEYTARAGQGRRELHEFAAHQDGSDHQRLLRRDRARYGGLRERRIGREHLRGARRQDSHAAAGRLGAARDHARHGVCNWRSDLEIPMVETIVPREMLYIADEVFFSGTAAEITPIRSIDRITDRKGPPRADRGKLQKEFFAIINGTKQDRHGWLSPVYAQAKTSAGGA